MHVNITCCKKSISTCIQHACCTIQDMHVAPIDITCCKKKHVNMHSTCMLHNSRHACCANQDEINHVALTCARLSRAERVVHWYTFSTPHTNNAPGRLMHTVISFIHLSGLSPFSFSANLLTIFIPSFVFPHLIYHICNLYRGLPLPSPSLLSATAHGGRIQCANPVQAQRAYRWTHRASEQCIRFKYTVQGILSKDLRGINWYDNSYLLLDYQRVWLSDVHTKDYYHWFDNQGVWWHHLIITDTYTFDNVISQKNSLSLTIFTEALLSASPILSPASLTPSTTVRSPVTR